MAMQFIKDWSTSVFLCLCFIVFIFFYQINLDIIPTLPKGSSATSKSEKFKIISHAYSSKWYQENCFKIDIPQTLALENLAQYLNNASLSTKTLCRHFTSIFNALFRVEEIHGLLNLSPFYLNKLNQWLHNDELLLGQLRKQRIVKVYNRYTHEEMVYNFMRSQRPQTKSEVSPEKYTSQLLEDSQRNCDFCGTNYLNSTAEDEFGRLERPLSYTAANTFKYDRWHTLVVSRNHDTLHLTEEEIVDMFELGQEWFFKVYSIEPMHTCPEMIWDAMPKSGASQIHTHLQVSLGYDIYYGNIERLRQGARFYTEKNSGRNYFNDYLYVHHVLGLTIPIGTSHVIVHLTPIKDLEIMIMDGDLNRNFYKALHLVFRSKQSNKPNVIVDRVLAYLLAFVDDLNEYSFSFGMFLPPMNETATDGHEIPVLCRLVFRNPVTNLRSDMNGLDLYTSSVIGKDRYALHRQLKDGIAKRLKQ